MIVEVWFYSDNRIPSGSYYRPHFIIKETDEYLGVQFENLQNAPLGERIICDVKLLYEGIDYSNLTPNTAFYIKEGSKTVGEGVVISL
jgi:translation elongation factor EF-Tu-like GTPase